MSKKNGSDLAVIEPTGGDLAVRLPDLDLGHVTTDDMIVPRAHLYQGLPAERKQYGDHKPGDLVNSLTGEKLASTRFVPLTGPQKLWIRWKEPRGSGMEYMARRRDEVPAGDLDWTDQPDGSRRPPAATEIVTFIALFEGENVPVGVSFKGTSARAGKTITSIEMLRKGRGPGLYEFGSQEKSNAKGEWLSPVIRPVGDCPAAMRESVAGLMTMLAGTSARVDMDASDE